METRQLENVAIAEGSLPVDAATEALFKAETAKMDTDKMWIIMGPQHPRSLDPQDPGRRRNGH